MESAPVDTRETKRRLLLYLAPVVFLLLLCISYLSVVFIKPTPLLLPTPVSVKVATSNPDFKDNWPLTGQGSIGAEGYGILASSNNQTPQPTASVAKIMNALLVLKQHPLKPGEQGPMVTLTVNDAALYDSYVAKDGSVARVTPGENITEYQLLQALLLPSADNIADTLAIWAYGSVPAYAHAANSEAQVLGMTQTEFSTQDASGLAPDTISTAHDLVLLGEAALQNPVIAEIVAQPTATIPVAGVVHNVNWLLGSHGVNGIKTGNSNDAGGVYLFSSKKTFENGQSVTIVGAIMDKTTDLGGAMNEALPLLQITQDNFQLTTLIQKGQVLGTYKAPWGGTAQAIANESLTAITWQSDDNTPKVQLAKLQVPISASTEVGIITSKLSKKPIPIILTKPLLTPSFGWRFKHVF